MGHLLSPLSIRTKTAHEEQRSMSPKYAIGIDFGTESGRALLVEVADGREVATAVHAYGNGVIDERLPESNVRLECCRKAALTLPT
jgi:sugar (pentulose or hexulose) kinase